MEPLGNHGGGGVEHGCVNNSYLSWGPICLGFVQGGQAAEIFKDKRGVGGMVNDVFVLWVF